MKKRALLPAFLCLCTAAFLISSALATPSEGTAESIVEGMTLEQKIGQMLMPAFRTWEGEKVTTLTPSIRQAIQDHGFGGVILFSENTAGTAATTRLICDMQDAALTSGAGLPLLMAVDQEGGSVVRLGTGTSFCGSMALAASGKPSLAQEVGSVIGGELAAEGFQVDFAPDMDVNVNPSNPVIGIRSFSDSPRQVALFGSAFIEGLHSANIAAALKHFPGHGDTVTDSHSGLPCIDKERDALLKTELVPFQAGIAHGADIVMTAHIQYPQIEKTTYASKADGSEITLPATLSQTIVTGLLREELGFDGVVCTDAMNMAAIAKHFDRMDAARLAINAGVDILLMPVEMSDEAGIADCGDYLAGIAQMVRDGSIQEKTIDAAVTRILNLKIRLGLMDYNTDQEAQVQKALSVVGSRKNHDIEWDVTTKAITLVKNIDHTLPFHVPAGGKAVLFCSYPNEVNAMTFALDRLKAEGIVPQSAQYRIINYNKQTSAAEYEEDLTGACAVLASVESSGTNSMNPASPSGWQAAFLDDLITRSHALGKQVGLISLQLPYDLARYQAADALLAAYNAKGMNTYPADYNGETPTYGPNLSAAVYTAFGGCTPTGALPVSIPVLNEEYRYTEDTLYPNGYGSSGWNTGERFTDVPPDAYYAAPVAWAAAKGITTGTAPHLFSPVKSCSRAQVVTFLWRAAGCPIAAGNTGFTDVPDNAYYANAVKWAVGKGITTGESPQLFGSENLCTRVQIVTFLARFAGEANGEGITPFADVPQAAYYAPAVRWAVENGITTGTGPNLFSPDESCTRAQTVTLLYRYFSLLET